MERKYTKGEWTYNEQVVNNGSFYRVKSDTVKVCNVVTRNQEEAEANAKLIACAPEMLSKLKETMEVLKWYMNNTHPDDNQHEDFFNIGMNDITEIDELISKATTL